MFIDKYYDVQVNADKSFLSYVNLVSFCFRIDETILKLLFLQRDINCFIMSQPNLPIYWCMWICAILWKYE